MGKRKKIDNNINLDDFFFGDESLKKEKPDANIGVELVNKSVNKTKKETITPKKKHLDLTSYLEKNDIILKHIHIGSQTKKKLMKSAEILGINQYDLATNVLEVFFKKYGETIKNMEEDIL